MTKTILKLLDIPNLEQITQQQQQQLILLTAILKLPSKIKVICATCKKEFYKKRCEFIRSLKDEFYCNRRCFADRPNNDRVVVKKRQVSRYKYDTFFRCCKCEKWIPKQDAKWHKTRLLNQPRCPQCNTLMKQSPRNAKFKKNNKNNNSNNSNSNSRI